MAEDDLPRLDLPIRRRVLSAIENKLAVDPLGFGKPLSSTLAHFRSLRAGDYRIVYAVEGGRITILAIGHRARIYETAARRT